MSYDSTKPNVSQLIGDVILSANANDVALKKQQDDHEANATTAHGIDALIATQSAYNAHAANLTTAHGIDSILVNVAALLAEIASARGSKSTVALRLAQALNADGSIRLSTLNNKWINNSDVPTYIAATRFSVPGDRTKVYIGGAQLRLIISGTYTYASVASSSYGGGVTTITLDPAYQVLTAGLSAVEIGLIAWDNAVANSVTQALTQITALQGSLTAVQNIRSKVGDPTSSDLPAGQIGVWKNTSSGALKLWANDGGTLKSATLA